MKHHFNVYVLEKQRQVVVTTKYKGKTIRAVAKCAPEDEFNAEIGTEIATDRCKRKLYERQMLEIMARVNEIANQFLVLDKEFRMLESRYYSIKLSSDLTDKKLAEFIANI